MQLSLRKTVKPSLCTPSQNNHSLNTIRQEIQQIRLFGLNLTWPLIKEKTHEDIKMTENRILDPHWCQSVQVYTYFHLIEQNVLYNQICFNRIYLIGTIYTCKTPSQAAFKAYCLSFLFFFFFAFPFKTSVFFHEEKCCPTSNLASNVQKVNTCPLTVPGSVKKKET